MGDICSKNTERDVEAGEIEGHGSDPATQILLERQESGAQVQGELRQPKEEEGKLEAALTEEISKSENAKAKHLEEHKDQLQVDYDKLKDGLERVKHVSEQEDFKGALEVERNKTEQLQADNDKLKSESEAAHTRQKDLEAELKEEKNKSKQLQADFEEKAKSDRAQFQNDMSNLKHDKDQLEKEKLEMADNMKQLEKYKTDLELENGKLSEELKKLKETHEHDKCQLKKESKEMLTSKDEEIKKLTSSLKTETQTHQNKVTQLDKELAEWKGSATEKDRQIQHLSTKLSAEMATKLAADESNVENVSIKNRPMNVAEEYQLVCTDQWLDAKQVLDDEEDTPDHTKLQLLCKIIYVAADIAKEEYSKINHSLEMLQTDAVNYINRSKETSPETEEADVKVQKKPKANRVNQLNKELQNSFSDILRITADTMDLSKLTGAIGPALNESGDDNWEVGELWSKTCEAEDVKKYVDAISRICWKMVIQRPPMEFKVSDKYEGEQSQDLAWNSAPPETTDAVVVTVYPMLYHNKSLMAKGKVLLLDPAKNE